MAQVGHEVKEGAEVLELFRFADFPMLRSGKDRKRPLPRQRCLLLIIMVTIAVMLLWSEMSSPSCLPVWHVLLMWGTSVCNASS